MTNQEEVEKLRRENEKQRKEIERLKKIEEEYEKHKRYGCTFDKQPVPAFVKEDIKHIAKVPGQKNGHKGYARHIPARIDFIKPLNPSKCPECGTLLGRTQEIRTRYVTDIKLISDTKTTYYEIHRKYCRACKKLVEQPVPNALPYARFGLNIMLLVMYLKLGLRMPGNKIREYFSILYSLSISEGEIVHILKQLAREYGNYYKYLENLLKMARVKHTDSTGWRINGRNYFAWVFIAAGVVLYKIHKRNNHKVPLHTLGRARAGDILVVDRHSAFRTLAEKAGFLLQLCWSHILQDSKELARDFGAEGRYVHKKLKEIYALATGLNHKGTPEMVEQLKGEIFQLIQRHYMHLTVWKFVRALCNRDLDNLFRFVTDHEIDPTNNVSERELRALVIIRKISNGSRSIRGANATALLLSIIQTLRFKKENVLLGLKNIINSPSFGV